MKEKRVVNIPIETYELLKELAIGASKEKVVPVSVPQLIGLLAKEKKRSLE